MTVKVTMKLSKKDAQKQIDDLLAEFHMKGKKGTVVPTSKRRAHSKTFGRR